MSTSPEASQASPEHADTAAPQVLPASPPIPPENGFVAAWHGFVRWLRTPSTRGPRDVPGRRFGAWEWVIPLVLVALAAAVRFIGLDHPHQLVFDETYYVKDAWSLSQLGYEAKWPEDANVKFEAGETNIFETAGTRVVHPPLGKWIIALGMMLFGADSSFGWRFSTALLGVGTVLVTYLIARRMTRSVWWGGMAGLFIALDGLSVSMSRVSLLDGILTFFVMLGVLFIVYDHRHAMARIATGTDDFVGPSMWNRPWVVAAGVAFGVASAVKWSGFAFLAAFGIYLVAADAWARRRAGVRMWGSAAIGRQAPITFLLFVPAAMIVYLSSWIGWMITSGGYSRDASPNALVALWTYHSDSLGFHVGLDSTHPYASPAWQWPFLIRPTAMYWDGDATDGTVQAITAIPNPLLWWAGCAAALFMLIRFVTVRDWRFAIVLVGLGAAYLPWLAFPNRTIFMFYTVLMAPFLMIALVLVLQHFVGPPDAERAQQQRAWRFTTVTFTAVAVAISLFFLPLWTGMPIQRWFWQLHMWLTTWI